MKRNEMISLIYEELKIIQDKETEIYPHDSEKILNAIEKAGMLPPVYYPYTCSCSMFGMCPVCNLNEYILYNRWEPEDE